MIKLNGVPIEVGHFPDGSILMKPEISSQFSLKFGNHRVISWQYENDIEFVAVMYLVKHLQSLGFKKCILDMPYIPNARQDRVKTKEDVFTLKYFAELINSLDVSCVRVLDPHSSVSEALINRIEVCTPEKLIKSVIETINDPNLLMYYPDEGAMKRYSGMVEKPYVFGIKDRDWKTGKINGVNVAGITDKVEGRNILIVDDICSKGGTFYHGAKKLKELGANKIYLFVSHCENSIHDGALLKTDLIEKIFTTNSILTKGHEKIEVMNYDEY